MMDVFDEQLWYGFIGAFNCQEKYCYWSVVVKLVKKCGVARLYKTINKENW